MGTKRGVEIIPLNKHKRITLRCPNCEEFALMDIRKKTRVNKKINYYVICPQCGYDFKQIGRPYNYWRDIKQKHKINANQLRSMQSEVMRGLLKRGEITVEETKDIIKTGNNITFIKPKKGSKKE